VEIRQKVDFRRYNFLDFLSEKRAVFTPYFADSGDFVPTFGRCSHKKQHFAVFVGNFTIFSIFSTFFNFLGLRGPFALGNVGRTTGGPFSKNAYKSRSAWNFSMISNLCMGISTMADPIMTSR
jgi:hypothetical protein